MTMFLRRIIQQTPILSLDHQNRFNNLDQLAQDTGIVKVERNKVGSKVVGLDSGHTHIGVTRERQLLLVFGITTTSGIIAVHL